MTECSDSRVRLLGPCVMGGYGLAMNGVLLLLVPLRALEQGVSAGEIGLLVAAGSVLPALASVQLGAVVDRVGAKRSFLLGTGTSAILAAGFVVVEAYAGLLGLQLLLGLARTLAWVASQTYVTQAVPVDEQQRATSWFSFSSNASAMIVPFLAGVSAHVIGVRLTFWCVAGLALLFLLSALPVASGAPIVLSRRETSSLSSRVKEAVTPPGVRTSLRLTYVALWISAAWTAFFPLLLVQQGSSTVLAGFALALRGGVATATSLGTSVLAGRCDKGVMTAIALAAGTAGLLVSPWTTSVALLWLPSMLVGIANGASLPWLLLIMSEESPAHLRGLALGVRMAVNQLANTAAPLFVGLVAAGAGLTAGFAGGAGVAAVILVAGARSTAAQGRASSQSREMR